MEDSSIVLAESSDREEIERIVGEYKTLRNRIDAGFVVDFKDFSYEPTTRKLSEAPGGLKVLDFIGPNIEDIYNRLESYCAYNDYFRRIPVLQDQITSTTEPYWENWWLPGLDACILYGLLATNRPKIYLEVGSGNSTKFVRRAISDLGLNTKIISIDPHPMAAIDEICDEVIRRRCEDVDIGIFNKLSSGDILFIDNSHRSFQNSDVTVFFSDILPSIPSGVIYGLHDIFLPWDYPESWNSRFYNEQYLLLSYIIGGAGGDKLYMPAHYVYKEKRFRPLIDRLFVGTRHIDWLTGSFWMQRG